MVTRKDMEALADILAHYEGRENIGRAVANYIETQNPRFDRAKFYQAARLPEKKEARAA